MKGIEALDKIEKYVKYNEIEKYDNKKLFKKIDKGCEDKNDFFYCHYIIYSELQKLDKLEKVVEILKKNLIVKVDEGVKNKDVSYLVIAMKTMDDNLAILYETFDEEKIKLLKEVLENE